MPIELTTISTKRFLLFILTGLLVTLSLSVGLAIRTGIEEWVLLIFPGLLLVFAGSHIFSRKIIVIEMDAGEFMTMNNIRIYYRDILGYINNEAGLTQSSLGLRLQSEKTVHIAGSKFGKEGKIFKTFKENLIARMKLQNPLFEEMIYQDIYVKEGKALRLIVITMAVLIIITDLLVVLSMVTGQMNLPWQLFFINSLFIGLIPYMKKGKQTNKSTGIRSSMRRFTNHPLDRLPQ